jgi:hypothetical protein
MIINFERLIPHGLNWNPTLTMNETLIWQ